MAAANSVERRKRNASPAEWMTLRPVHVREVMATLYHQLGVSLTTTIPDLNGRPQYVADCHQPIRELV